MVQLNLRLWDLLLGERHKVSGRGPGHPALGGPDGEGLGARDLHR